MKVANVSDIVMVFEPKKSSQAEANGPRKKRLDLGWSHRGQKGQIDDHMGQSVQHCGSYVN